jgi:hypothetical protein
MGWTDWRKIAEGSDRRAAAAVGHDGAATYELGLRRSTGGDMTIVYVGETENERTRIVDYVRGTTPLESLIADALQKGFALHYRATAHPTVTAAQAFRDALLMKYGYSWNKLVE